MSKSDIVSDVLTRIRNAQRAGHAFVVTDSSKFVKSILSVMIREGYINEFQEFASDPHVSKLKISLKYHKNHPVIEEIKRVSKPGLRVYSSINKLKKVYGGLGVAIISTSKGVMSDTEARSIGLGGEVICQVF